jgi:multimeric flavodoxin WrbA
MYGHVEKLAEEIKKGASSVEGVEVKLWQVRMCIAYDLCITCYIILITTSLCIQKKNK